VACENTAETTPCLQRLHELYAQGGKGLGSVAATNPDTGPSTLETPLNANRIDSRRAGPLERRPPHPINDAQRQKD
jgi:hypothetical protein